MNLVKKYSDEYKNRIEINKDKLIESFIMYYGEEYRDLIIEKFNNIIFLWYLDFDISCYYDKAFELQKRVKETKKILKMLDFSVSNISYSWKYFNNNPVCYIKNVINEEQEKFDEILLLLFGKTRLLTDDSTNFFRFTSLSNKKKNKFIKKIYDIKNVTDEDIEMVMKASKYANEALNCFKDMSNFVQLNKYINKSKCNKVIGLCGSNKKYYSFIIDMINKNLEDLKNDEKQKNDKTTAFSYCKLLDKKLINYVVFKMGIINDKLLIHEINHNISYSLLFKSTDAFNNEIIKCGISSNDISILEEILVEKSAIEINNNFKKLNGNVFDDYFPTYKSIYEEFFPLVDRFYDFLKEPLKKIRIEENGNLLYKYVDKQLFVKYCEFVETVYKKSLTFNVPLSIKDVMYANKLIDKMIKKEDNEMTRQEMIDYLKSIGCKLKVIEYETDKVKVKI